MLGRSVVSVELYLYLNISIPIYVYIYCIFRFNLEIDKVDDCCIYTHTHTHSVRAFYLSSRFPFLLFSIGWMGKMVDGEGGRAKEEAKRNR